MSQVEYAHGRGSLERRFLLACYPSLRQFLELAQDNAWVPVWTEVLADTETPVSLYLRLRLPEVPSFLLESAEDSHHLGRYSIMGFEPWLVFTSRGATSHLSIFPSSSSLSDLGPAPLALGQVLAWLKYQLPREAQPEPFAGGLVGYIGYDAVRQLEHLPNLLRADLDLPETYLVLSRLLLIYDHLRRTVTILYLVPGLRELPDIGMPGNSLNKRQRPLSPEDNYRQAVAKLEEVVKKIDGGSGADYGFASFSTDAGDSSSVSGGDAEDSWKSNFSRLQFLQAVERAKDYIAAGEALQIVLSQRLELPFQGDSFSVYRQLRRINPSPYMFYLDGVHFQLAGSSPEMLVKVQNRAIETRPIAGTRPRGRVPEEDARLAQELLADPKERAEHLMLVDLGRNDLGRVAAPGSVQVPEFMVVEHYSHVMHLVSRVTGCLDSNRDPWQAFWACFPAGTVSGAPKVRAMEIIEELEPNRRGPYAGAVGYLGLNGNLDTCITIRTLVFTGGKVYAQAGAGIVADSRPEAEYQETLNKARALLQAVMAASRCGRRLSHTTGRGKTQ